MSTEQKLCELKIFQLQWWAQSMSNAIRGLRSRITVFRAWPWYSTLAIREQEPVSALTRTPLYAALSIIFLFGFYQWQSRADSVLSRYMNIRLPLFWSTWSRARGPDSATCAGLAHGRDYCDRRASEEMSLKCLAHELSKILENKGQRWGFFNPYPPESQTVCCTRSLPILSKLKSRSPWRITLLTKQWKKVKLLPEQSKILIFGNLCKWSWRV